LLTETRNPRSAHFDRLSIAQAFELMNDEDARVVAAVRQVKPEVCAAIEMVSDALASGGRLIYVGAGTSGRLGVLDASECPPTFLSDPSMVRGIIAGGWDALRMAVEGAEDHPADGAQAVDEMGVGARDVVFGITTGGTTPFVHGALKRAHDCGAKTILLSCVSADHLPKLADVAIHVLVGPEVVTGSTRLKAGTATKMILNMVTTIAMTRLGKVYQNLMVDVNTKANAKLVDRGVRIIQAVTGVDRSTGGKLLEAADGHVKTALVMHIKKVNRAEAERLLTQSGGRVGAILQPVQ